MAELQLRDYQREIVTEVLDGWERTGNRLVVWLPTGGGKTEIACALAQREFGHTLFLVERKTLAGQGVARFAKYGMTASVLRGEDTMIRAGAQVTVASIQTLASRADHDIVASTLARTSLVIIDEAHIRFRAHDEVLAAVGNAKVVGLTATPLRDGLGLIYDDLIRGPSYADMIAAGHLVKPRYFLPPDEALERAVNAVAVSSTGDFVNQALSELMRRKVIIGDVVDTWQRKAEGRPTIVFAVDKAHSRELCNAFNAEGIRAEHIEDRTPQDQRAALFAAFRRGDIKVLCSIGVLAVGFDEPVASCAVLARPTLSLSLHIQQAGRVMRPHEGKTDCIILDHAGNVQRHGRVEDFEPPELSEIDRHSDRKKKADSVTELRPCPECRAVLEPKQRVCPECGHEISRAAEVIHIDAELTESTAAAVERAERDQMRDLYLQLRYIGDSRGYKPGWAFMKLKDAYGFSAPYGWKDLSPVPPTPKTLRLEKSWRIAWVKSKRAKTVWRTSKAREATF